MSPLVRKDSIEAGSVDLVAMVGNVDDLVVTSVRTGAGRLKVIVWQAVGHELQRKDDLEGGPIGNVSICSAGVRRVATTIRNEPPGNLALNVFGIGTGGQIHQLGGASAGTIGEAAPAWLGSNMLATPLTDSAGNLKVIAWELSANGEPVRRGSASAGAATLLASANFSERFVTALRDGSGNLKLIQWTVSASGDVQRAGDATGGPASDIAITYDHESSSLAHQDFITAVRDSGGNVELAAWQAKSDGTIAQVGEISLGPGSKPSLAHVGFTRHAVAFADDGGNLRIQCFHWGVQPNPANPKLGGDEDFALMEVAGGGAVSRIAAAGWGGKLVTAVRTGEGTLKMILWALE